MRVRPWSPDQRITWVVDLVTLLSVALVYVVVVLGGGLLIGSADSPSIGLSVLATALVALGLEPMRSRLRAAVAHRFGGGRRAPYDVLSGFTDSLTYPVDEHGPLDLPARLARHLATGTGASWAEVWLEVGGAQERAAIWPPDADGSAGGAGIHTRDVVLDGERVGTLRVREPAEAPFGPVEQRLLADLAVQAGIALLRVRLREELARRAADLAVRADELQESRRRLVDAHDAERRRLERDIHDGAQQHLVALVVNLRLAQSLTGRAPSRAAVVLTEQIAAVDDALATLGDLSRGLYPTALLDEGVGAALRSVLSSTSAPITVDDREACRLPGGIEAALYFCALEAVQNAVKHAAASAIHVRISSSSEQTRLEVTDDGVGFAPGADPAGHGLGNMRDRIDTVGGRLTVQGRPGAGVTVRATVPAHVGATR